jgi:hypothetical protein
MPVYELLARHVVIQLTLLAQWRYVKAGILALLRYLAAYCNTASPIRLGTTNLLGYVGEKE